HICAAGHAGDELTPAPALLAVTGAFACDALSGRILDHDLETAEIERLSGGLRDLDDALMQALLRQLAGAVVAVRIVAARVRDAMSDPGAAAVAHVPVIAGAAEPAAAVAVAADRLRPERLDRLAQGHFAREPRAIGAGWQRGAALDLAVGLEPEVGLAGGAAGPVRRFVGERAPAVLVGPEIADAVAGQETQPDIAAALEQVGKRVHD